MLLSSNDKHQIQCAYKYFRDNVEASYKEMLDGSLDMRGIKSYVQHIPIRDINEGWPDWFYVMTDRWLYKVYEYLKHKGYIKEDDSYEVFLHMITRLYKLTNKG